MTIHLFSVRHSLGRLLWILACSVISPS